LTVAQLSQMSPVKLTWDDEAISRQVDQALPAAIVGKVSGA